MELSQQTQNTDAIANSLRNYAQNILVVIFGLLPLFFLPTALVPFEYTKIFVVFIGLVLALILFSLSALRSGTISIGTSYTIIAMWTVAGLAFVSSLLSGDFRDSLIGDVLNVNSTVFVGILALIMSVWVLLDVGKAAVMRLYMLLSLSTITLVIFHTVRLFTGPEFLSFGIFTNAIATPLGSWNDLALFLGLSVILSLVALEQLSLTKSGRMLFSVVTIFALFMLAIINFFTVWFVLGLTSLVVVVYVLGKDRFSTSQLSLVSQKSTNLTSVTLSLVVFVISVLFIIGGSALGGFISKYTNISYIEVRPSLQATVDIARDVYQENAFFGIGTNKFKDAWRLYKDEAINTTVFWNTDFNAGNGYITTFFVTTGALGGIAWIVFLSIFLVMGIRFLLTAPDNDRMWYFIGVSSFVSAAYIWGMSIIYVPGGVILLLGALCTAITLTAYNVLKVPRMRTLSVTTNRNAGFVLTLLVIVIIISSVGATYSVGRHYASGYVFNKSIMAFQQGVSGSELEAQFASAYELFPSDIYARTIAEYELARINQLLAQAELTEDQQKQINEMTVTGVNAIRQAISDDPSASENWAVLGRFFSTLISSDSKELYNLSLEPLTKAKELNPKNPIPYLELAVLEGKMGNFDAARSYTETAIALKPNFTDAFFYLSQIELVTGKVEEAIKATQSIIALEPQNPARYYQLGVLQTSQKNDDIAIAAFEEAIRLDPDFANARYLLALAYDAKGRGADAKKQLERVLELNPGNEEVIALIKILDEEGSLKSVLSNLAQPNVNDPSNVVVDENTGTVSTDKAPNSSLVSPVNTAPTVGTKKQTNEEDSVPEAQ